MHNINRIKFWTLNVSHLINYICCFLKTVVYKHVNKNSVYIQAHLIQTSLHMQDKNDNSQHYKPLCKCVVFCNAGFLPSLKKLLTTPAYFLLLCGSVLNFNSLIGLITFKAKYMEQQFGQSASRANFLIGEFWLNSKNSVLETIFLRQITIIRLKVLRK